jgi:hypothetical protein
MIAEADMAKAKRGRPKTGKVTKDAQIMMRTTEATAAELTRIAQEMDRSVSWLLNDLATKFIASRKQRGG